jgi:hypothetical protein
METKAQGQKNTQKWVAFWLSFAYALVLPVWASDAAFIPMLSFCGTIMAAALGTGVANNGVLR